MSDSIEQQIKQLIAVEVISAQAFSNALFSINGLFNKLVAATGKDRKTVSTSPLFRQAQARLTELERIEADFAYETLVQMHAAARAKRQAANGPPGPVGETAPEPAAPRSESKPE
jgi:hypothetical protein